MADYLSSFTGAQVDELLSLSQKKNNIPILIPNMELMGNYSNLYGDTNEYSSIDTSYLDIEDPSILTDLGVKFYNPETGMFYQAEGTDGGHARVRYLGQEFIPKRFFSGSETIKSVVNVFQGAFIFADMDATVTIDLYDEKNLTAYTPTQNYTRLKITGNGDYNYLLLILVNYSDTMLSFRSIVFESAAGSNPITVKGQDKKGLSYPGIITVTRHTSTTISLGF